METILEQPFDLFRTQHEVAIKLYCNTNSLDYPFYQVYRVIGLFLVIPDFQLGDFTST